MVGMNAKDGAGPSSVGRLSHIMLATDGSEFSAGAERVALAMAAKGGASLTVMTAVITSAAEFDNYGPDVRAKAEAHGIAILERVAGDALRQGIDCNKVLRFGDDPHQEIIAEAEQSEADVIVIGRRGKRGLARLMLGDATAKVIGDAGCSVMVVPKAAEMWESRLLLATDGSGSSDAATVAAARIAHCCGAPVTVLSVKVPRHARERQAEADAIVGRALSFFQAEGIEAEGIVDTGAASDVIAAVARNRGADLIIMGSHGRTGLGRLLLGSNAQRVIGQATCPVLVVKN